MLRESADKNMRRIRQLMEFEARHIPTPTPRLQNDPRSRLLDINPAGTTRIVDGVFSAGTKFQKTEK